ncbi:MAG: hypothetical protein H6722_15250 [Sandaracinus sp.]|nr:hypothetical protein [Sandaracinus sp.]MCB9624768.1 hypothetical protein [Sandaracinus sp.]
MALGLLSTLVPLGLPEALLVFAIVLYGLGALVALVGIAGAAWSGRAVRRGGTRRTAAVVWGAVAACLGAAAFWNSVRLARGDEPAWTIVYWGALGASLFVAATFALTSHPPR